MLCHPERSAAKSKDLRSSLLLASRPELLLIAVMEGGTPSCPATGQGGKPPKPVLFLPLTCERPAPDSSCTISQSSQADHFTRTAQSGAVGRVRASART